MDKPKCWVKNVIKKCTVGFKFEITHSKKMLGKKMLGCFNPTLGQIWTNPAVGLNFYITFLTQHLSIFDPKLG